MIDAMPDNETMLEIRTLLEEILLNMKESMSSSNTLERTLFMSHVDIFKPATAGVRWQLATAKRFYDESGRYLEPYGYKVYSQNDEDGIINEIFRRIGTTNKRFIEFGVEDGLECNTHFLLHNGWTGLWLEGSSSFCESIRKKFMPAFTDGRLSLRNVYITRDNINDLFVQAGFEGEIDLLSIDIDGNDYHIWKAINVINPRVVVIEYNAKLPPECNWYMPYNEFHMWDGSDRHGASLKALELLGREKGYQLVGTNFGGANAFFVRKELAGDKFVLPATAEELYNPGRYMPYAPAGHPSKVFLDYKKEGLAGLFEIQADTCGYIAGTGFWPEEILTEHLQWMKEPDAQLYVQCNDSGNAIITIHYQNLPLDNTLSVQIDDSEVVSYVISPQSMTGRLELGPISVQKEQILIMKLHAERVVVADNIVHNGDTRMLGIGIHMVKLRIATKNGFRYGKDTK